jgi:SAM-dependent methyltransferase
MKEIPCIFCDIHSDTVAIEENGFTGKRCPECGLIYISPRPSLEEIIDLYGHNSAHITAEEHISDEYRKRMIAKHHLKKLKRLIKNGKLLEIGAGAGFFLDEARKKGFEPYGLEFNPRQVEFVRNSLGIPCEKKAISTDVFGKTTFDVIYHCDVVSHLFDPIQDFKVMNRLLNKDGILFFETGNFAEVDPKNYRYIRTFMYPDHLFFFGLDNLKTLLNRSGFELVFAKRYSVLAQFWLKNKIGNNSPRVEQTTHENINSRREKGSIHKLKVWINYILRYWIGSFFTSKKHPQTILIGAKKIRESHIPKNGLNVPSKKL